MTWTAIDEALPQHIVESLRLGLPCSEKLRGYDRPDAVLTGVETRSSSPVTVTETERAMPLSTRASTLVVRELDMPAAS